MIWFGTEPLVAENPGRALEMAAQSKIPMITQYIARRCVDANALETLTGFIGKTPEMQIELLEGMLYGLQGRSDVTPPANWKIVYAGLQKSDTKVAQLALEIAQQFGDSEAAQQSLAVLKDQKASIDKRRSALQLLAGKQRQELLKELPALLEDTELRMDVIKAIASFDSEELGKLLMKQYASFTPEEKSEVVQTMSSRPKYGWMLTNALKDQIIAKRDVPASVARQLRRVVGSGFVEIWGPIDEVSVDQQAYAKYQSLLTASALSNANTKKGQMLFQRTCGSCHKMYGKGGSIGPDLTGSNRTDVDYLLFNVLNPSGEIQDDYKLVVITTRDGRTYSGNISAENDRQITLRIVGQDAVIINKANIQSREVMPVSMMPNGLFETLNDTEIVDLVAYLRTMK
jgi:putative heme-binding domain-containing protein